MTLLALNFRAAVKVLIILDCVGHLRHRFLASRTVEDLSLLLIAIVVHVLFLVVLECLIAVSAHHIPLDHRFLG
jgi:hypothetical protein